MVVISGHLVGWLVGLEVGEFDDGMGGREEWEMGLILSPSS